MRRRGREKSGNREGQTREDGLCCHCDEETELHFLTEKNTEILGRNCFHSVGKKRMLFYFNLFYYFILLSVDFFFVSLASLGSPWFFCLFRHLFCPVD